ncbi:hypothetical protein GCM10028824_18320 [Hymenobacter segetis]
MLSDLLAVSITGVIYYTPIYDAAGTGTIVDFTFEYLNPAAQRMMHMPEVPAVTHNQQWPHSKAHGTFAFHVEAFETGEPREYNINYQADGYDNYYRLAARRTGDGLLVSFTDTSDQPRTPVEVALREAQARTEQQRAQLEGLFMQAPAALCRLDGPDLVYALVNPVYQQLFPGRPLLGLPLLTALPELRGHAVWATLQRVYHSGETHVDQGVHIPLARTPGGPLEDYYFNYIFQADFDAESRPRGVLVYAFDVTHDVRVSQELQQLNQELETRVQERTAALQETEARFRIMADAAPNQVWAVNPDGTIRYANQAFLNFVGVSLEQYVATGWAAYLHPEELDLARNTLAEAIETRNLYTLEHRMRRHDGQYRWLLAQGAPSFYPNGDLYGYVGSAIDITELKQTNERLTRTNQDLDNFVYAASHDLKQPVNNLGGLFEELRRSISFADLTEEQLLMPLIQDALQQLGHTIDDLAALGQAQQTSEAALSEEVPLADLLEEVVNTLEPQARAARARITVDFAARPAVAFARANLRTVLLNLLSNSLKYADPARPARIHVSVWVEEGQPVLVVEDNGLGFDAEKHGTELFQLFRRLHTHTPGSGVGLYLVNRIVQAHGGSIAVDSQPGAGATFRIRLGRA